MTIGVQDYVEPWEIVMNTNDPSTENCFFRSASFLYFIVRIQLSSILSAPRPPSLGYGWY